MNNKSIKKFLNLLSGPKGCDFKERIKGDPKSITFQCDGETRTKALSILKDMKVPQKDINDIIDICEHNGGYCDCEILLNAEEALLEKYKK